MAIIIKGDSCSIPPNCMVCPAAIPNNFHEIRCYYNENLNVTNNYFERHDHCPMVEVDDEDIDFAFRGGNT